MVVLETVSKLNTVYEQTKLIKTYKITFYSYIKPFI